jgi:cytoskeletal protein CcmA (bactofilin family)
MFKEKDNGAYQPKEAETIIGQSVRVKGNFHGTGNIIIEGIVEGSVTTNSHLMVGSKSKITAAVEAKDAQVAGEVVGNVKVQGYLDIRATARIQGDIECETLSIEKGAQLNGNVKMGKKDVVSQ